MAVEPDSSESRRRAAVLRAESVSKSYGTTRALDGVNVHIAPGEFVALLGPNGAGKTTLFQLLTGLFAADSGDIVVDGHDLRAHAVEALATIGVVFQQQTLDLDLSVRANLRFHTRLHGISGARSRERVEQGLARLGLAEHAPALCRTLSGGNRRKVELARALLHEPKLLLMDEPTVGLDPASRRTILEHVHRLCHEHEVAVLWATHLVDEAEAADRVLVLHRGSLLIEGPPAALLSAAGAATLADAFLALTRRGATMKVRLGKAVAMLPAAAVLVLTGIAHSGSAGAADGAGLVFVSSEKDNMVTVFDAGTMKKIRTIQTGARPRDLKLSPDRSKLYVAASDADAIEIIDLSTSRVIESLAVGSDPETFDISRDGRFLYVSNEDDAELTIYDLTQRRSVAQIAVGDEPEGVIATPDGKTVYVASEVANMVHAVDVATRRVTDNILVGTRPRRFALTPDGRWLWVTNELSGSVSIIDTTTNRVDGSIEFAPRGFRPEDVTPVGMVITGSGTNAYVTLGRANHVAVVDVQSRQVEGYILVGRRAWGLALSRDETVLYVANGLSDDVSMIDTKSRRVTRSVPAGRVPHTVVVDD